jgi:hypothetical protein
VQREHGTPRGARQHQAAGETPCTACARALSRRRTDWRNAQSAALRELAAMYPTDFRRLMARHKSERGLTVKEVPRAMRMTEAEKVKARAASWHTAAKRLISKYRAEFDRLYAEEKRVRGL